jgi:hypothetical protein
MPTGPWRNPPNQARPDLEPRDLDNLERLRRQLSEVAVERVILGHRIAVEIGE